MSVLSGNWSAAQQSKWTWVTATMTVALMSMAVVLSEQKRRRVAALLHGGDGRPREDNQQQLPRRRRRRRHTSDQQQHELQQNGVSALRRESAQEAGIARTQSSVDEQGQPTTGAPITGLRLGNGVWDYVLVPLVTESIGFFVGLLVIYLTQAGRVYVAVVLLVVIFVFRVKSTAFSAAFAPLTENSKFHVR